MRKTLRRYFPKPEAIFKYRLFRWMEPVLGHPRLWHMHRRSVSLGVAIGLVAGLIPGPIQMLAAILVSIPLRANVPAAAAATWFTNPLTFVPLYLIAYQIGALVTGDTSPPVVPPDMEWTWTGLKHAMPSLLHWMEAAGSTLLVGLAIEAVLLALIGYLAMMVAWRITVTLAWRHRARQRCTRP